MKEWQKCHPYFKYTTYFRKIDNGDDPSTDNKIVFYEVYKTYIKELDSANKYSQAVDKDKAEEIFFEELTDEDIAELEKGAREEIIYDRQQLIEEYRRDKKLANVGLGLIVGIITNIIWYILNLLGLFK
ncbi:MAG: hypothetical protein AAF849_25000 [Bacteroidota bacterium]